jgi:dephospho-CoA kinase
MPSHGRLVVGLTGGVASGKSTVSASFAARGVSIIDADRIAHELTAPGAPGLVALVAAFGPGLLGPDGNLDRAALRARLFSEPGLKARVEALLHPLILARLAAATDAAPGPYLIQVVPLLVETDHVRSVDRVLVVACPPAQQLARLQVRDGLAAAAAGRMLDAQATPAERLAVADDVLDNGGEPTLLPDLVDELDVFYRRLAATGDARCDGRRLPRRPCR